jgi:hypothetical protein
MKTCISYGIRALPASDCSWLAAAAEEVVTNGLAKMD